LARPSPNAVAAPVRPAPCRACEPELRVARIALFESLAPEALRDIEKLCRWRTCAAGERIIERDDDGRDVYFIVRGAVQVVNYSLGGREIGLGRIGPGGFFGELAAIDGKPRAASVIAAEDCLIACMAGRDFERVLRAHPDVAFAVLRRLAELLRRANDRIMDVSTLSAGQRVIIELLRLADDDGEDGTLIRELPAHREIAAQASTTRETVARTISQLTAEGLLARGDDGLLIRDRALLEEVAAEQDPGRFTDRRTGLDRRRLRRSADGMPPAGIERRSGQDRRRAAEG